MLVANCDWLLVYLWRYRSQYSILVVTKKGEGPAWANSLFEDNAEFGLGMRVSVNQSRDTLYQALEKILALPRPLRP